MTIAPSPEGSLALGHVLAACAIDPADVLVIRHTYNDDGLRPGELTAEKVLAYTRRQRLRFNANQPKLWLNFIAVGGRRGRFWGAFENQGEVVEERTDEWRGFDLHPSNAMGDLKERLTVEWSRDAINWSKKGASAAGFPVVEIVDPQAVPFPGFDRLLLTYAELQEVSETRASSRGRQLLALCRAST